MIDEIRDNKMSMNMRPTDPKRIILNKKDMNLILINFKNFEKSIQKHYMQLECIILKEKVFQKMYIKQ